MGETSEGAEGRQGWTHLASEGSSPLPGLGRDRQRLSDRWTPPCPFSSSLPSAPCAPSSPPPRTPGPDPAPLTWLGPFTWEGSNSQRIPVNWGDRVGVMRKNKVGGSRQFLGVREVGGPILTPSPILGFFQHHQAILRHHLGVPQFNSSLTLSTWRQYQIPQVKGSDFSPHPHPHPTFQAPTSSQSCHLCF